MRDRINGAFQYPDKKFCYYTGNANQQVASALGIEKWDWTPEKALLIEPFYGDTHTIALAMGGEKRFTADGKEWVEPCIKSVDDIANITVPDVYQGRTGEIIEVIKKLQKENPGQKIRFPDIQSPLGIAELMWDDSFYMALITNPDEVHQLLKVITEFVIKYVKALQTILGNKYNPSCFPHTWSPIPGYYIADDTNSMVSPEMHLDYSIRYINQITKVVGPLFYHSCTWLPHYFDNMKQIQNAKAMNWSIIVSDDPAKILENFSGSVLLCPHIHLNMHKETGIQKLNLNINSEYDMVKYILDHMLDSTTLYMHLYDDLLEDIDKAVSIYELFDYYGYSPAKNGY